MNCLFFKAYETKVHCTWAKTMAENGEDLFW